MNIAPPSSVDTRCNRPENGTVGTMVWRVVAMTAATWLGVNVDTRRPKRQGFETDGPQQGELGIQVRRGDANTCGLRRQFPLGTSHVESTTQCLRGHPHGDLRRRHRRALALAHVAAQKLL